MADYNQWNEALCNWFFRPDLAGQPVYLSCDPSVPAEIAQTQGWLLPDPLEDLLAAVKQRVGHREPLDPWVRDAVRWRGAGADGNPPWVAVLAVTVLAAAGGGRAECERALHDRSYYTPLRRLLGLPDGAQPRSFDSDISVLWKNLNNWLDDDLSGARGVSTASATKHLPNVGWALSQTLLSAAERSRLPEFFRAIAARPGEDIDAGVLLASYVRWASRHSGQAALLAALRKATAAADMLGAVLHHTLCSWDGRSRDERGRVTLPLLLGYHSARAALQIVSRVGSGLDRQRLIIGDKQVLLGDVEEYFLLPVDPAKALAGHQILGTLSGRDSAVGTHELRMQLHSADLHVLASNVELAMWVEVHAASFGQEHVVIVREHAAEAAEKAMADLGGGAIRLTRIRLPPGWCAYQHFEPTHITKLPSSLTALLPSGAQLAHLDGGLPVDLRSRTWLTCGPPDLILPGLGEPHPHTLQLNGQELGWPVTGRLSLRGMSLPEATHEVIVAGRNLRFTLVDEAVDHDGRGDVRLTVDRRPVRHAFTRTVTVDASCGSAPGVGSPIEITICGASVTAVGDGGSLLALPPLEHIQLGGRYYALGRPGQAARLTLSTPAWLGRLDQPLYPRDADLAETLSGLDFDAHWLLHVSSLGRRTITSLRHVVPALASDFATPPDHDPKLWAYLVDGLDEAHPPIGHETEWQAWLDEDCVPCLSPARAGQAQGSGQR